MSAEQQRSDREDAGRPTAETWAIPRRVWFVLMSWGLAVLVMAGLVSFWIWRIQQAQVRAMCDMMTVIVSGPEPPAGPAGARAREISQAMSKYQAKIGCDRSLPELPPTSR